MDGVPFGATATSSNQFFWKAATNARTGVTAWPNQFAFALELIRATAVEWTFRSPRVSPVEAARLPRAWYKPLKRWVGSSSHLFDAGGSAHCSTRQFLEFVRPQPMPAGRVSLHRSNHHGRQHRPGWRGFAIHDRADQVSPACQPGELLEHWYNDEFDLVAVGRALPGGPGLGGEGEARNLTSCPSKSREALTTLVQGSAPGSTGSAAS